MLILSGDTLYRSRQSYDLRAETLTKNIASAVDQNVSSSIEIIDLTLRTVADELERQLAENGIDESAMNAFLARQERRLPETEAFRVAHRRMVWSFSARDSTSWIVPVGLAGIISKPFSGA